MPTSRAEEIPRPDLGEACQNQLDIAGSRSRKIAGSCPEEKKKRRRPGDIAWAWEAK